MKRPLQFHSALVILTDMLAVSCAYLIAYYLRFHFQIIPVTRGLPPLEIYLYLLPAALVLWLLASGFNGLYAAQRKNSLIEESLAVAKAGSLATLTLVGLTFFYREYTFSRAMLLLFWAVSIGLASLARIMIIHTIWVRHRRGHNLQPTLIVGAGPLGQTIAQKIRELPQLGLRVIGFVDDDPPPHAPEGNVPRIGNFGQLSALIRAHRIGQVFIALPREAHRTLEQCLLLLDKEVVDVRMVPDILQFVLLKAGLEQLDGIPIINLSETPLSGWYRPVKRLADILCTLAGLVILSPLFILFAILVKLSSPGPVFYRQKRMSLDGTLFTMLKFRSMRVDAEEDTGAIWARPNDPRRTTIGAFLRRTSLDEIPQLINILKGEMSFVGPRPERPEFVEQFRKRFPRYMLRHKVKCGLTGWAQVNGWRGNTSIQKRIDYDIFYIENWSPSFDLKIIWLTFWAGLLNKHAY